MAKPKLLTAGERDRVLATWDALWRFLSDCTQDHALQLLVAERTTKRRKQFLLRIHSRYNYLRAHAERAELRRIAA